MHENSGNRQSAGVLRSLTGYSWPVVAAMILAVVSIALAFYQSGRVSDQLIRSLRPRAESIAEGARRRFETETGTALRRLVRTLAVRPGFDGDVPTPDWPTWMNGILVWDGREMLNLRTPVGVSDAVNRMLADRSAAEAILESTRSSGSGMPASGDFDRRDGSVTFDQFSKLGLTYASLSGRTVEGRRFEVTTLIDVGAAREEILVPLMRHEEALEVVPTDRARGTWVVQLHRPFRAFAVQPSDTFRDDLAKSMRAETMLYVTLSTLSVVILLINLLLTVRVARRETALAELKAEFVARISHELKTPLALIRMFGETLQTGRVNAEEKKTEYYGVIVRESERLTHMIDNILDFARIDAGKQAYVMQVVDVEQVVRETYEAYTAQLEHKGFSHGFRVEGDVPKVLADPHALAQVLVNLMGNAIKYSQEEKRVEIELRADTRRNRRGVLLSVIDCGIGIRAEDRRHLFEGYYRADDQRVKNTGGTGLGLAVVKHIVDAHDGTLDVESRLVKGTIFRIFLPGATLEKSVTDDARSEADVSDDSTNDEKETGKAAIRHANDEGADHGEDSHRGR